MIIARFQDTKLIYKSVAFLYTNNDKVEFEIKITFILAFPLPQNKIFKYKSNKSHVRAIY